MAADFAFVYKCSFLKSRAISKPYKARIVLSSPIPFCSCPVTRVLCSVKSVSVVNLPLKTLQATISPYFSMTAFDKAGPVLARNTTYRFRFKTRRLAGLVRPECQLSHHAKKRPRTRRGLISFVGVHPSYAAEAFLLTPLRSATLLSLELAAFSSFRFVVKSRTTSSWPSSSAQAISVPYRDIS
jgi:hypothetical protein